MSKPIFIAEIKMTSPYGYKSPHAFIDIMKLAIKHGDWISVHTNKLWGGDYEAISFVRKNTNKPILAKGLHSTDDDIQKSLDHGADYVLVVDRFPYPKKIDKNTNLWDKCLFEIHDMRFLQDNLNLYKEKTYFPSLHNNKFVYNFRDLRTGLPKKLNEINMLLKQNIWTCQASGIKTHSQIVDGVDAFIVGSELVNFCNERSFSNNNIE